MHTCLLLLIWTLLHHNTQPVLIFCRVRMFHLERLEKVTWFHSFTTFLNKIASLYFLCWAPGTRWASRVTFECEVCWAVCFVISGDFRFKWTIEDHFSLFPLYVQTPWWFFFSSMKISRKSWVNICVATKVIHPK